MALAAFSGFLDITPRRRGRLLLWFVGLLYTCSYLFDRLLLNEMQFLRNPCGGYVGFLFSKSWLASSVTPHPGSKTVGAKSHNTNKTKLRLKRRKLVK
jgi:hypothetical protein